MHYQGLVNWARMKPPERAMWRPIDPAPADREGGFMICRKCELSSTIAAKQKESEQKVNEEYMKVRSHLGSCVS